MSFGWHSIARLFDRSGQLRATNLLRVEDNSSLFPLEVDVGRLDAGRRAERTGYGADAVLASHAFNGQSKFGHVRAPARKVCR